MQHAQFPLWGGTAVVAVEDPATLVRVLPTVRQTVERFDAACSSFRLDSELARLNRGELRRVGSLLFSALEQAMRAARLTDGDVDPTVGCALVALGLEDRGEGGERRPPRLRLARVPGWHVVRLRPHEREVELPPGVQLDLGATAKALAADCAAASAAAAAGGEGVLVSLGGDVATAGHPPDGGWRVRVTDDHRAGPHAPGQWITIRDGGLASSSTTVRRRGARDELHHIVDPRTGAPAAEVWRTASVTAATCLDANIASTAAILRGARAPGWLEELRLPSRLVSHDGRARHLAGWPVQEDDLS
jgi:thiamine biosynthesis lipoprotein